MQDNDNKIDDVVVPEENPEIVSENVGESESEVTTKSFTQEEVNKVVEKRLERAIKKFQEKLEAEKTEAEKLARMSEKERMEAEFQKQKDQFEMEKKQYQREKLELQTIKELSVIGLPTEFSEFVMADNADKVKANIESLKDQWEKAIDAAVNSRMQGSKPKASTGPSDGITKEDFVKMGYNERLDIFRNNPVLYKKLAGE